MSADHWDSATYERFRTERERPAHDLLALVRPAPGGRSADLGCGTGRHAPLLHEATGAATTLGIDTSPAMLAGAADGAPDGVMFREQDIASFAHDEAPGTWDVLFANASLHWVPDHEDLVPRLATLLRPGGQLVFQVPANYDHASHVVADEVGRRFGLAPLEDEAAVLSPARYAEVLHGAGLLDPDVTLRIYGMALDRTDDVVGWVSGSLLTAYERRLGPDRFPEFRAEYRRELLARLGDPTGDRPYYFAFPRILCAARRPT